MGHSLSGTLTKWDNSLSGTLFSVPKPKMNLTKWETLLFEISMDDVFITFQGESGFGEKLGIIKPISLIMMADRLKMYCLRKGIPDAHLKVPCIRNSG